MHEPFQMSFLKNIISFTMNANTKKIWAFPCMKTNLVDRRTLVKNLLMQTKHKFLHAVKWFYFISCVPVSRRQFSLLQDSLLLQFNEIKRFIFRFYSLKVQSQSAAGFALFCKNPLYQPTVYHFKDFLF